MDQDSTYNNLWAYECVWERVKVCLCVWERGESISWILTERNMWMEDCDMGCKRWREGKSANKQTY